MLVVQHVLPLLADAQLGPVSAAHWHCAHAVFALRCGELADAERLLDRSLQLARDDVLALTGVVRRFRAAHMLATHDLAGAERELQALEDEADVEPRFELRAWLALLHGNGGLARQEAEAALRLATDRGRTHQRVLALLLLAQICVDAGLLDEALRFVGEVRSLLAHGTCPLLEHEAQLDDALVSLRRGDGDACVATLRVALATGAREQYVSHWGWTPTMLQEPYSEALRRGIATRHVQEVIRRHATLPGNPDLDDWPWPVRLYTLGRFEVHVDGCAFHAEGKAPHKPIELLKMLVAAGERGDATSRLIERLWPDRPDGDGRKALEITVHRLRKLLACDPAVRVSDRHAALDVRRVWVDAWQLERLLAGRMFSPAEAVADATSLEAMADRVLDLYRGPFLAGDDDAVWQLALRDRLAGRFRRYVHRLGAHRESCANWEGAHELYERAVALDPLAESFYRGQMNWLRARGRRAEALDVYRRCRQTLSIVLSVPPSPDTEHVHRQLLAS
jgi:DNA-binding SARP family transcriptional activator